MNTPNPFNITTAVDYSDEEINKYWVDFTSHDKNFLQLMKTESPMPMYILGGKGSGKTHILRYFSFNSRKLVYREDFLSKITADQYLGIYLRCGGLNSSRFQGSSFSNETWRTLFAYYIELWFAQLLLQVVEEVVNNTDVVRDEIEICREIVTTLFDRHLDDDLQSFNAVNLYLRDLQKKMDYEINNCSVTGKINIGMEILVSPGKLIFGIPKVLRQKTGIFKNFQFIFLIDEFENLLEYQQQHINTLVREREAPVTFRVGARWYGVKTYKTFSGDEDIKEGSEYEKYIIDKIFRENDDFYEKFVKEICLRRIRESGYSLVPNRSTDFDFSNYYDQYDISGFLQKVASKGEKAGHLITLKSKLTGRAKSNDIQSIISNLRFPLDVIVERTNVFIFYREWKRNKRGNLVNISESIKDESVIYFENLDDSIHTRHAKVLDKFKNDIVDQLFKESQEKIPYVGFDKLTKMSVGIPRLLLITLKHIHRWSIFQGEIPFRKDRIGFDAQMRGVEEASNWFIEDARIAGANGRRVSDVIKRLGQYLQELRFSDTPPECSICSFSLNVNDVDEDIRKVLDYLEQYSYLINVPERTEKNSVRKFVTYQINGLIAPKWDLPLFRRGIIQFNREEVSAIFGEDNEDYERLRRTKMNKYNVPFSDANLSQSLFDEFTNDSAY